MDLKAKIRAYIPLINKLIVASFGIYYFYLCDEFNCINLRNNMVVYMWTYYGLETLLYLTSPDTYYLLPHHIISLYMLYLVDNKLDYNTLRPIVLGLAIIEKSGAITDYRDILKKEKQLTSMYDVIFLIYYVLIRQFYFAYHLYYDYQTETFEQKMLLFLLVLIYFMSAYWSVIWFQGIIKYNKKIKNASNKIE